MNGQPLKNNLGARWTVALAVAVGALALGGCASPVKLDKPAPVETRNPAGTGAGAGASATPQSQVGSVDLGTKNDTLTAADRVVYFDFDSSVVKDEYKKVIEANAKVLNGNRTKRIRIEGNTDERGGREYNLALGQRRAEAVERALALLGVKNDQMEAVSYGKERPAVQGSNEEAWAKNRRAELKDK